MKALEVSKVFLLLEHKYLKDNRNTRIMLSNLKLQKMLFFSQALHMKLNGERLFDDEMEAWQFGPVVREVYKKYGVNGSLPISTFKDYNNRFIEELPEDIDHFKLSDDQSVSIIATFINMMDCTSADLIMMCHKTPAWLESWYNGQYIDFEKHFKGSNEPIYVL